MTLTMPTRSKRSKLAKELQHQKCTGFVKHATALSPDGSVYYPSDNNAETLSIDIEDRRDNQAMVAVTEPLQCLYTEHLPDHLQLNPCNKCKNRLAMYTKESSTIAW